MHKSEFIPENVIHKILLDFEIQTDHRIPTRKPGQVLINKKKRKCHLVDISVPVGHWGDIKEIKKVEKILRYC